MLKKRRKDDGASQRFATLGRYTCISREKRPLKDNMTVVFFKRTAGAENRDRQISLRMLMEKLITTIPFV